MRSIYDLQEVDYDPHNARYIATKLMAEGVDAVEFRQGYLSLSPPTKEIEKLVISRDLRHGGHPVLRWNAANTMVTMDAAGNIKPAKDKSTEKIDGIVALMMALGAAMVSEGPLRSVYEDRGVMAI